MTLRQAAELSGISYDENNKQDFGDEIPWRWDLPSAKMVEKFYNLLPAYFHEPDGMNNPLLITRTRFGENCFCGGNYNTITNVLMLDDQEFSPSNERLAFEVLTHESTHHLQDLGYSRLAQKLPGIFHKDIKQFCADTINWLDTTPPNIKGSDTFFLDRLRYGVQDILSPSEPQLFSAALLRLRLYLRARQISAG